MTYPGVLFWILALATVFRPGPALYYLFFVCWSFGTLLVMPNVGVGNLTAPWVAACLLIARVVMEEGWRRYLLALVDLRRFGVLTLCTIYAAISGVFMPRLFEGQVRVVTMRPSAQTGVTMLAPDGANLTQGLYFVLTTLTVVSIYFVCQEPTRRRQFLQAFGWGAFAAILTGLLDLMTSSMGLGDLLTPFRNAKYALLLDNEAAGMHRVIGLMSEASAYAGLCVPFLSLIALMPAKDSPWGRWRTPLAVAVALMSYLSTSSAGYVSLAAVGGLLGASLCLGMLEQRRHAWWGGYAIVLGVGLLAALLLVNPNLLDPLYRVVEVVVVNKTSSNSYADRSLWNRIAWDAFIGTQYLGTGIGGARASSWIYSMLSNIGAPGTLLMFVFIAQVLFARAPDPADRSLARAARLALIPSLLIASLAGTSSNFGLGAAAFFGLAAALCWPAPAHVRQVQPAYRAPRGALIS